MLGLILVFGLFFAVCSAVVAQKKGRSTIGWLIGGFFFGIFAFILVLLLGPAQVAPTTLTAQLDELGRLRRKGTISEAEYDTKKAQLLGS